MPDVNVNVAANISKAKKDLLGLEKDIKRMQTTASKGINFNGKGGRGGAFTSKGASGNLNGGQITDMITNALEQRFGGLSSKLGQLGQLGKIGQIGGMISKATPYAAMAYGGYKLLSAPKDFAEGRSQQGKPYYDNVNRVNLRLGQIQKNLGGDGYVKGLTKAIVDLGTKGKVPLEQLETAASRLMLAFSGDQQKVEKFVRIVADISAATGHSTDEMSDLISKVYALGRAEESMLTQLNEKGVPIYKALADQLGVSVEQVKEMAKQGKITADEFTRALDKAHELSVKGANEGSVVKDAAYYEKQIADLNAKINSIYTQKMEAAHAEAAERKLKQEQEYFSDPAVTNMHEAAADLGAAFQRLFDDFSAEMREIFNGLLTGIAQIVDYALKFSDYHENKADDAVANSNAYIEAADRAVKNGGWGSRVEMLTNLELSPEAAALELKNGGKDKGLAKISQEISKTEDRIAAQEWTLNQRYVDEDRKKLAREALAKERELLSDLNKAKKAREDMVSAELERLRVAEKAKAIEIEQLQKEGQYIQAWNKAHPFNDEWGGIVKDEEEVISKYNQALEDMRSGKGTEAQQAFVKYFEPIVKNAEAREQFTLERKAKNDAGAAFMLDYQRTADAMRKIGFSPEDILKEGDFMHAAAKKEHEDKLAKAQEASDNLAKRAHELGYSDFDLQWRKIKNGTFQGSLEDALQYIPADAKTVFGNANAHESIRNSYENQIAAGISHENAMMDAINCMYNTGGPDIGINATKREYERGAWGQGLALDMVDPTLEEIRKQREDLEKQLKTQEELLKTAQEQVKAINDIDIRAKAL